MTYQIYFSPTGNTEKVVRLISQAWEGEAHDIDCSVPDHDYSAYSFTGEDFCVVGVPSFGGRVPAVALAHLQQMRAAGTPTVIVVTFGNRDYDDTLLELRNTLKESGFHVIAAVAAVTEHSIMHQFATGRPNSSDEKELRGFAEKIQKALECGTPLPEVAVKGNSTYRAFGGLAMKPTADEACIQCGICAAACPMKAIPVQEPSQTDNDSCITCMRCIAICPQNARALNPAMLLAAGQSLEKVCSAPKENELYLDM